MVRSKSKDLTISFLLFILGLLIITPIFLMFISSLKDDRYEIMKDMGSLKAFIVTKPTLHNFKEGFLNQFRILDVHFSTRLLF